MKPILSGLTAAIVMMAATNSLQAQAAPPVSDRLAAATELDRAELIALVLDRNPSIDAALHAWRAAEERYAQAVALDDPMLMASIAPLSTFGDARLGGMVQASQSIPYPGKRRLRGEIATAEAAVMRGDYETTRLQLASAASELYDGYYLVHRSIEINQEHLRLLRELKESAEAQYVAGRASQQDPLQAEVEITKLLHQELVFETQRRAATASINELLGRRPEAALPPPPSVLPVPEHIDRTSAQLQSLALESQPALAAAEARVRQQEAAVSLAERDFYPDFNVLASYNSMWMETEHQIMAGVSVNLPIQRDKRRAAIREAEARAEVARSRREAIENEVRSRVDRAHAELLEGRHIVTLYLDRLLPAARDQVAAARAGFDSGRNSFLAVIEAERNFRAVELNFEAVVTDLYRRLALLERTVGLEPLELMRGVIR